MLKYFTSRLEILQRCSPGPRGLVSVETTVFYLTPAGPGGSVLACAPPAPIASRRALSAPDRSRSAFCGFIIILTLLSRPPQAYAARSWSPVGLGSHEGECVEQRA
jgi:hypothetical protein